MDASGEIKTSLALPQAGRDKYSLDIRLQVRLRLHIKGSRELTVTQLPHLRRGRSQSYKGKALDERDGGRSSQIGYCLLHITQFVAWIPIFYKTTWTEICLCYY